MGQSCSSERRREDDRFLFRRRNCASCERNECGDEGGGSECLERDVCQSGVRHNLEADESAVGEARRYGVGERYVRIDDERRERQTNQRPREIPRGVGKTERWKLEMCRRDVEFRSRSFRARTLEK